MDLRFAQQIESANDLVLLGPQHPAFLTDWTKGSVLTQNRTVYVFL